MRVFTIFPPIHRKNIYAPELRELLSNGQVKTYVNTQKGWRPSLQIIRGCTIFLAHGDCEKGRGSSANGSGGENASVVQEQVVRLHTGNRQHTARGTVLGSRHIRN